MSSQQIIFYILATVIALFSVLAVTSKQVIRAATYLLFVLLATAGLFLILNFHYLFAVQVTVYAGGIMILFIMAIFLTHKPGEKSKSRKGKLLFSSALLSIVGLLLSGYIVFHNVEKVFSFFKGEEISMSKLGLIMMGSEKYNYLLNFEAISVLLLACIVGAILIARKDDVETKESNLEKK